MSISLLRKRGHDVLGHAIKVNAGGVAWSDINHQVDVFA